MWERPESKLDPWVSSLPYKLHSDPVNRRAVGRRIGGTRLILHEASGKGRAGHKETG
ncbi:hypothetical protein VU10_01585 [Desulfobulbus sp. US1]|nr:hypothetical protein [Desulfobulbus sp. US4]MCW5205230.1 hypothetical protein [Desulfobulbus sp. N2]MCW5207771.1 hypothetical protein [Desulfobulbus sp. US2]MCW5208902.1 hypothetical protein [Desulfobulbus sp. US1]MCW5214508.1 hypothetical protein [Desulfobulbus sp. US5]WLE97413.1 MAG: hypothetical protein QTN59_00980 [Candidatus Electrothrix communis]